MEPFDDSIKMRNGLEGLLRVFSFLGLGLSLMGLSWFYSRFVFRKTD
jgi:uncharacterized membrane protein